MLARGRCCRTALVAFFVCRVSLKGLVNMSATLSCDLTCSRTISPRSTASRMMCSFVSTHFILSYAMGLFPTLITHVLSSKILLLCVAQNLALSVGCEEL